MFWVFAIIIVAFIAFGLIVDIKHRKRNNTNFHNKHSNQVDERVHYNMGENRDL